MYLIDQQNNTIKSNLQKKSFSELGFKERQNLQKWIAENPEMLGEELLIIQEEFDGFNDTNERLDLLALDKEGNIVVIENKLDDTGRNVTWQVLKYASYCSTLTKEHIREIFQAYLTKRGITENATDLISEFMEKEYQDIQLNKFQSQRIMMVAGNFRKEVTSTALWLLNYKLQVQCFKASIYALGEQLILDVEQIIPTKDAADYVISMAGKAQEELTTQVEVRKSHQLRHEFWIKLLDRFKGITPIYQSISPSKDHWLSSGGTNVSGVYYACLVTRSYAGIELGIGRASKELNKEFFDELIKHKDVIETGFGKQLDWERLDDKKMSRLAYRNKELSIFEREDWDDMLDFFVKEMVLLEKVMRSVLKEVKQEINA